MPIELVYNVDLGCLRQADCFADEQTVISLSSKNILAASKCVNEPRSSSCIAQQFEVHVVDLDKPYEGHKVTSSSLRITNLAWDAGGTRLLVVDSDGLCELWQMKGYLLNEWTSVCKSHVAGEEVLAMAWLHNGVQITFNTEKKDSILYSEKFSRTKFIPSVSHFGAKPLDGWVVITASGLVCVNLVKPTKPFVHTVQENLSASHIRSTLADIAYMNTGELLVAIVDEHTASAVQCFKVTLKMEKSGCKISCKASASLYMISQNEAQIQDNPSSRMTHLQFVNRENSDTLMACCGNQNFSCIELWQLVDQIVPVHKMFQSGSMSESSYKTQKWVHKASVTESAMITGLCGSRMPTSRNRTEANSLPPYIALAYKDGTMKLIHNQGITKCGCDFLSCDENNDDKRHRTKPYFSFLLQTFSGCGILGVSDSSVYLLRSANTRDGPVQMSPSYLSHLLEYSVIAGIDWWDILLAVRPGMVETICQKLSDNYRKQAACSQEILYSRLMAVKMCLYRSCSATLQKASDCHAKIVLNAVATVFRGIIKPKAVLASDKSPAEKLTIICSKTSDMDLENLLVNLERNDFKTNQGTLQALQPLMQWVANFAVHLLTSLPLRQSYSSYPGSSLLQDAKVLNDLRELLVIIRMWGVITPACLPVFTMSSDLDILSDLFQLLTKALLCCKEGGSIDFDDTFMDECCLLSTRLLIPSMSQTFGTCNTSGLFFIQSQPQRYQLGQTPDHAYTAQSLPVHPEIVTDNTQMYDVIRQIHLGVKASKNIKECCRCNCQALLTSTTECSTLKSWEQRWVKMCFCGGLWKRLEPDDEE